MTLKCHFSLTSFKDLNFPNSKWNSLTFPWHWRVFSPWPFSDLWQPWQEFPSHSLHIWCQQRSGLKKWYTFKISCEAFTTVLPQAEVFQGLKKCNCKLSKLVYSSNTSYVVTLGKIRHLVFPHKFVQCVMRFVSSLLHSPEVRIVPFSDLDKILK